MADLLNRPFLKMASWSEADDDAWDITPESTTSDGAIQDYYRYVPWLFRAVDLRVAAVSSMPFTIATAGGEVIDANPGYENALGVLPNLPRLLGQIEAALCIWRCAYLFRDVDRWRYLVPTTVSPKLDRAAGLVGFTRRIDGIPRPLPLDMVCPFWPPDPFVEVGPPGASPARAAAAAAGVLLNLDRFAAAFFARGAIRATILAVPAGTDKDERVRLKKWWQAVVSGIKNMFATEVINADRVTPTVVGEGLESLRRRDLTESEREAVATAMGIPHSILFSGAANFAVADKDDVHFYTKTVNPECGFIQEAANEYILQPLGLRLRFHPEMLDIFQEDEAQRAGALSAVTAALENPLAEVGMRILGYEVDEESMAMLKAYWAQKSAPISAGADSEEAGDSAGQQVLADLRAWRRKALKRVKAGRPAGVAFESAAIPPALAGALSGALEAAGDAADVARAFDALWQGYP